jgi:hypothetical protein
LTWSDEAATDDDVGKALDIHPPIHLPGPPLQKPFIGRTLMWDNAFLHIYINTARWIPQTICEEDPVGDVPATERYKEDGASDDINIQRSGKDRVRGLMT